MQKKTNVNGILHLAALLVVSTACDERALLAAEFAEHQETAVDVDLSTEFVHLKVCAIVFWDGNFGGESRVIYDGAYESWIGDHWSDDVSSAIVSPGCALNVWIDGGFAGDDKTVVGNVHWIGNYWNDEISAWKCNCN